VLHIVFTFSLNTFSVRLRRTEDKIVATYPDDYPLEYLLEFVAEYKEVLSFFHSHHFYQALLTKSLEDKGPRMLQPPAPTRWGSIQACLYSILKAERVLHCIISDRNFIQGTSKQKAGQIKIRKTIMSESFIVNLSKSLKILDPINKLITMFQSDFTALSDAFKNSAVLGPTSSTLEGLHADEKEYLTKLAKYRFEFTYGDAHGISYVLDPRYIGDRLPLNIRGESKRLSTIIISMTRSHQRRRRLKYSRSTAHLEPGPCSNSR
jgi:hypothetical protein